MGRGAERVEGVVSDPERVALPGTVRGDPRRLGCAGLRHHPDRWPPDQIFHLRREWLATDRGRGDVG